MDNADSRKRATVRSVPVSNEALNFCHCFETIIIIIRTRLVPVFAQIDTRRQPLTERRFTSEKKNPSQQSPMRFNDPRIDSPAFQNKAHLN